MEKITGGYYIKARKIQDSAIAKSPPHVREIWDWMLKTANHKDRKTYGSVVKRGQVFTSYAEISNELSWKIGFITKKYQKWQVDNAMVWLRQEKMVTTQKTTRGLIITVCNYEHYQDPSNYDNAYDTDNALTRYRQLASTIHKNEKNEENGKEEYKKNTPAASPLIFFPKKEDYNGLPKLTFENIYRMVKATKQVEVAQEDINDLWEVFKDRNLTGAKSYNSVSDIYTHFENWVNLKSFKKKPEPRVSKNASSIKITGVEFLNEFTEVKMSDGSIQKLDINQQALAENNLINPKSIVKK